MVDWSQVPVQEENTQQPVESSDPLFLAQERQRGILGGREVGGLGGSIVGGILGSSLGPLGTLAGSAIGAGAGGALGELSEQYARKEEISPKLAAEAGASEALWDAGGNLVFKLGGKVIKIGSSFAFNKNKIPDATKAAQDFLEKQGSSLPKASLYDSGVLGSAQSLVTSPVTADIFKGKEEEIRKALMEGRKDLLSSYIKSPEFDNIMSIYNVSPQYSSGRMLKDFIGSGEKALSDAVTPVYKEIFKDTNSRVSMFNVRQWADKLLSDPAALTQGQRSIIKEFQTLPTQLDMATLHNIRSRWLAESRDKYSALGSERDSRAVGTISDFVKLLDGSMDFAASRTLNPDTLKRYKDVTKQYREGVQSLRTDSVMEALAKNPEEVGGYLFAAGKETPVEELFKSLKSVEKLSGKSPKETLNALRYGYLEALTTTPDNIAKLAGDLQSNPKLRNTFEKLFDKNQQEAIKAMTEAAEKGLVKPHSFLASTTRGTQAAYTLGQAGVAAAGYSFLLTPEQQEKIKDNLGETAISAGALVLNQRMLAKALLDPRSTKAVTFLAKARDKLVSPSAFTKLVVEPLANIYKPPSEKEDIEDYLTGNRGSSFNWNAVPVED